MGKKLSRRQALKAAGAAALGGLAISAIGGMPRIALAQEKPSEAWEAYIDQQYQIEMGTASSGMYFQVKGQDKNAPLTLEVGKIVLLSFMNADKDTGHNAHIGKDANLDKRHYNTPLIDNFFGVEIDGGQTGEIVFQVPNKPGDWEMGCFVTGHYEAGMKMPITVK